MATVNDTKFSIHQTLYVTDAFKPAMNKRFPLQRVSTYYVFDGFYKFADNMALLKDDNGKTWLIPKDIFVLLTQDKPEPASIREIP